jgi:hemerythrin-like domain-containing protein
MRATAILMSEHRVIEQVLACLEKVAEQCAKTGKLDETAARQAIDFFQNFADRCHHHKEERHLFPMLELKGFSRRHGPTGVMLQEHSQGREHLQALTAAVNASSTDGAQACQSFVQHAHAYVDLLRAHIAKEDLCLFPMADEALTEAEQSSVAAAFHEVESHDVDPGAHERFLRLADDLADRFGVSRVRAETAAAWRCCPCGHGH